MKRIVAYLIPIMILAFFVAVMNSGGVLKQPFGENDDVYGYINKLEQNVKDNDWEKAESNIELLTNAWKTVEKRIQFSVELVDIDGVKNSISRLRGAIKAKDSTSAYITIEEAKGYWDDLED